LGRKLGEWSKEYGSAATKRKIYLGRGRKYFDRIGVAEFEMETHSLRVGDEIMITGPTTGFIQTKVEELRVDDRPVEEVKKGDIFSVKVPEKVRPSDKLYKVVEVPQNAQAEA
jgi:putative protease